MTVAECHTDRLILGLGLAETEKETEYHGNCKNE